MSLKLLPNAPGVRAEARNYGVLLTAFGSDAGVPFSNVDPQYIGIAFLQGDMTLPAHGCLGQSYNAMKTEANPIRGFCSFPGSTDSFGLEGVVVGKESLRSASLVDSDSVSTGYWELIGAKSLPAKSEARKDDFSREAQMERAFVLQNRYPGDNPYSSFGANTAFYLHLLYS